MTDFNHPRHIVLVHGAWQGSWAFEAWRSCLVERGFVVHALDLPGNQWPPRGHEPATLESCTEAVLEVLDAIDEPAVLVGHSGGGLTASQAAEARPSKIKALVYLAGMMLPSGMSFGELVQDVQARHPGRDFAGIMPWLQWNEARTESSVQMEGALQCFLHDCDPARAREAAALLRPQQEGGRDMRNALTPARYGRVPRIYVECRGDRSIFVELQQRMQELVPGAYRIAMDCGHVPQLADPKGLTHRLVAALADIAA